MGRNLGEARRDVDRARSHARRAVGDVGAAGRDVLEAGQAGITAVRDAAVAAGERVGKMASAGRRDVSDVAREASTRVGEVTGAAGQRAADVATEARRTATGIAARLLTLPRMARKRATRMRRALEATAVRAAVSVIRTGTRMLSAAVQYVSPRRRVDAGAVRRLVVEQLDWADTGTEAYDRAIAESGDTRLRMQLVRYKLQTIKEAETLTELLIAIGGRVRREERDTPFPTPSHENGAAARGPAAVREGLAHALTVAVQSAEGWRALDRIAEWAEQEELSAAIQRASQAVGSDPEDQVEFLCQAWLETTMQMVLA